MRTKFRQVLLSSSMSSSCLKIYRLEPNSKPRCLITAAAVCILNLIMHRCPAVKFISALNARPMMTARIFIGFRSAGGKNWLPRIPATHTVSASNIIIPSSPNAIQFNRYPIKKRHRAILSVRYPSTAAATNDYKPLRTNPQRNFFQPPHSPS